MTKLLKVPYVSLIDRNTTTEIASSVLNTFDRNPIPFTPWSNFPYKPDTSFTIAYGTDCIFLKYYIREVTVRAAHCRSNDPVYLDSCVEFFIAFKGEKNYYNLEFNCTGTCYGAYGDENSKRKLLQESQVHLIKCQSLIKKEFFSEPEFYWELTIVIPFKTFGFHQITSLTNERCKLNFYKCGDHLPTPHYLCWNDIQSPSPNFHQPDFFGDAHFL